MPDKPKKASRPKPKSRKRLAIEPAVEQLREQNKTRRLLPNNYVHHGRKTEYESRYDDMLVKYMAQGNTYDSFGAVVSASKQTLYAWEAENPSFLDAKQRGLAACERFMVDIGKMLATGQLRRLKSETPILDANGRPVISPDTGLVMTQKEYEPAQGNAAAWIFLCKNMFKWRDRHDVSIGQSAETKPLTIAVQRADEVTVEQRLAEIERLREERLLCEGE